MSHLFSLFSLFLKLRQISMTKHFWVFLMWARNVYFESRKSQGKEEIHSIREEKGKTEGLVTALDEGQRKERCSKRTTRKNFQKGGVTTYGSDITLCDRFFGSDAAYLLKTAFMAWLSFLCIWPRDDDYSSDYDLPLITIAIPQALTALDPSPQHHHQKFISTQPLGTPRRKSTLSQPLSTPRRKLRTQTTIPHRQHNCHTTEVSLAKYPPTHWWRSSRIGRIHDSDTMKWLVRGTKKLDSLFFHCNTTLSLFTIMVGVHSPL